MEERSQLNLRGSSLFIGDFTFLALGKEPPNDPIDLFLLGLIVRTIYISGEDL